MTKEITRTSRLMTSLLEMTKQYIMEENEKMQLPENAQRELRPGEEYQPLLSPKKTYPEVTLYSVLMGIAMAGMNPMK